jgi:hypothetical protein
VPQRGVRAAADALAAHRLPVGGVAVVRAHHLPRQGAVRCVLARNLTLALGLHPQLVTSLQAPAQVQGPYRTTADHCWPLHV